MSLLLEQSILLYLCCYSILIPSGLARSFDHLQIHFWMNCFISKYIIILCKKDFNYEIHWINITNEKTVFYILGTISGQANDGTHITFWFYEFVLMWSVMTWNISHEAFYITKGEIKSRIVYSSNWAVYYDAHLFINACYVDCVPKGSFLTSKCRRCLSLALKKDRFNDSC